MKSYVIYQGQKLTVEWYYDSQGRSLARDFFDALSFTRKKKLDYLIRVMGDFGKIQNEQKFRHEGEQIYAFKADADRLLCFFFRGSKIIVTNGFEKKAQKLPVKEREKALRCKDNYINRIKEGTYYD